MSKSNYNIGGCESIKSSSSFNNDINVNNWVDQYQESGVINRELDRDEKRGE